MLKWSVLSVIVVVCVGAKEFIPHGVHHPGGEDHYSEDMEHNDEFDHEAVLGSQKENIEFGEMPPHEAKKRLGTMVDEMDLDHDGFVSREELADWITNSFKKLNIEESDGKLQDQDLDGDGTVTWSEHISGVYEFNDHQLGEMEKDKDPDKQYLVRIVNEDRRRFQHADVNKDGSLDQEEYAAFLNPLDYEHMVDNEVDTHLTDFDKNNDGFVDLKEYQGDSPGSAETQIVDKENFASYDDDNDGKLSRVEMRKWVAPGMVQAAWDEVEHLFRETDLDSNSKLSKREIVDQHLLWVGSSATDYGEELRKHDPQEL